MLIKNKKIQIALAVLFWALTALLAVMIFGLSAQNGPESASLSEKVRDFLSALIGYELDLHIVRTCAHFLEYCAFTFSLFFALSFSFNRFRPVVTVIISALYAATDEIHQLFSDGRACDIKDFFVDSAGAVLTVAVLVIIIRLFHRITQRRSQYE